MRTSAEIDAVRDGCTRFLHGGASRRPADQLAAIPPDTATDRYGDGGVVTELEEETASLLGKPAAVFLPSGTMGQQITLRVHADRSGLRTVLFHPMCHLDQHEGRGYERLHGLIGRPVGDPRRLLRLEDLQEVGERPAALLLELPQRDIGGQLPGWDELQAQVRWARERGAAVHLDGARLWECGPAYGRSVAEIAALFDTVYVSFYKKLGGLAGCCVAGPPDILAEVREWRSRHGGTLFAMWPYAASDLAALRLRLPRMQAYHDHAMAIGAALKGLDGLEVVPDPPQVSMMHLLLRVEPDAFQEAMFALAERDGIFTWTRSFATDSPHVQAVELDVGDSTLEFSPEEVRSVMERLVEGGSR
jgi:threonine aldolase